MSIATKTGDDGTTSLMFGRRVSKTDARIDACGSVDELNAALGLARATTTDTPLGEAILAVQKELVVLMGEIAVEDADRARYREKAAQLITPKNVDALTALVDALETDKALNFHDWVMPGGTLNSAAFDLARTTCRRAERRVADLAVNTPHFNPEIIRYLNRLSDLCWLWGRLAEQRSRY